MARSWNGFQGEVTDAGDDFASPSSPITSSFDFFTPINGKSTPVNDPSTSPNDVRDQTFDFSPESINAEADFSDIRDQTFDFSLESINAGTEFNDVHDQTFDFFLESTDAGADFLAGWMEGRDKGYDFVIPPTFTFPTGSTKVFASDECEWVLGYLKGWHEGFDRAILVQSCMATEGGRDGGLGVGFAQTAVRDGGVEGYSSVQMPNADIGALGHLVANSKGHVCNSSSTKGKRKSPMTIDSMPQSGSQPSKRQCLNYDTTEDNSPASDSAASNNNAISTISLTPTSQLSRRRTCYSAYGASTRARARQLEQLKNTAMLKGVVTIEELMGLEKEAKGEGIKGWVGRMLGMLRARLENGNGDRNVLGSE